MLIDKAYGRENDECSEAVADADTWTPRLLRAKSTPVVTISDALSASS